MTDIDTKIYLGIPWNGSNIVNNPSFEDIAAANDFQSWTQSDEGVTIFDEGTIVKTGSHACKMVRSASGIKNVQQTHSVVAGERYRLSFWTRGDGSQAARFEVLDVTNDVGIIPIRSTAIRGTVYTEVTVDFTIPTGCVQFKLFLYNSPSDGSVYFDVIDVALIRHLFTENLDILIDTPVIWETGIAGSGPLDLVASTGILTMFLDNSISNSEGLAGLYSPGHTNVIDGLESGMPVRVIMGLPTSGANLVVNPGFETAGGGGADVFATWIEDTGIDGVIADEGVIVHSGSSSCKITRVSESFCFVDQSMTVVPRTLAHLSFWVRDDNIASGTYSLFDVTNAEFIALDIDTDVVGGTWTEITYDFIIPVGCVSLKLTLSQKSREFGVTYFDDASITVIMSKASVRFLGAISAIRPTSGLFENPKTEIEVHDWMGFLSSQETGITPVQENKTADQALTTLLTAFPIQPEGTLNFDTGEETFDLIFVGDRSETSMASTFQKLAQNELGRIYQEGDGTLRFENRHARPENVTPVFTLDGLMTEFEISYEQADLFNVIAARVLPQRIDAAATTVIWKFQGTNYLEIKPGETLPVLQAPYSDPDKGGPISAKEVVDPPTTKFGSVADGSTDDLSLGVTMVIGANSAELTLVNNSSQTGFVNFIEIKGKGIYVDDRILFNAEDASSTVVMGKRKKFVNFDLITDLNIGKNYAHFILAKVGRQHLRSTMVSFLANQSSALANAVIDLEISDRFAVVEDLSGISENFFINRLRYRLIDGMVWVEILPDPETYSTFIWDTSHWDTDDAHWGI